jgi:AcrR family transcriptional regulator
MGTKAERTQQRILDEAARLFNVKGYAATGIRDIMEATGLAKGGIDGNFESKEQIQAAAFEHALGIVMKVMGEWLARYDGAIAKLHAMLDFYERYVFDPPITGGCMILNTSIEADDTNPELRALVVGAFDRWIARTSKIIKEGIARGEIRKDVDVKAFSLLFIATVEGSVMLAKAYGKIEKIRIPLRHLHELVEGLRREI